MLEETLASITVFSVFVRFMAEVRILDIFMHVVIFALNSWCGFFLTNLLHLYIGYVATFDVGQGFIGLFYAVVFRVEDRWPWYYRRLRFSSRLFFARIIVLFFCARIFHSWALWFVTGIPFLPFLFYMEGLLFQQMLTGFWDHRMGRSPAERLLWVQTRQHIVARAKYLGCRLFSFTWECCKHMGPAAVVFYLMGLLPLLLAALAYGCCRFFLEFQVRLVQLERPQSASTTTETVSPSTQEVTETQVPSSSTEQDGGLPLVVNDQPLESRMEVEPTTQDFAEVLVPAVVPVPASGESIRLAVVEVTTQAIAVSSAEAPVLPTEEIAMSRPAVEIKVIPKKGSAKVTPKKRPVRQSRKVATKKRPVRQSRKVAPDTQPLRAAATAATVESSKTSGRLRKQASASSPGKPISSRRARVVPSKAKSRPDQRLLRLLELVKRKHEQRI